MNVAPVGESGPGVLKPVGLRRNVAIDTHERFIATFLGRTASAPPTGAARSGATGRKRLEGAPPRAGLATRKPARWRS